MRTIHNARYIFGSIILATHFLSIALYIYFAFKMIAPSSESFWPTVLGVSSLLPLTGIYATTFWRYVVRNPYIPKEQKSDPMDSGPFYLQLAMVLFFSVALLAVIAFFFINPEYAGSAFESIPSIVSLMEMLFGAFIGLTFSALFPLQWEQGRRETT